MSNKIELSTETIRQLGEEIAESLSIELGRIARRPEKLVSRDEMAELAAISVTSLDRLVSESQISSAKPVGGRRVFDPRQALAEIIEIYGEPSKMIEY